MYLVYLIVNRLSYSDRVFQQVLKQIPFEIPKDVKVLMAYIKLLLAVKCQDERMEHLCKVLWMVHYDLKYTYIDDLHLLRQNIYDCATEGRDDEIPGLELKITQLKKEYSEIQSLLNEFQQIGISYF